MNTQIFFDDYAHKISEGYIAPFSEDTLGNTKTQPTNTFWWEPAALQDRIRNN